MSGLEDRLIPSDTPVHANVTRMLYFSAAFGVASAITSMGVFDAYLFHLTSSNSAVGLAESISGISQVLVAVPAGYLVDRCSRSCILRWCALLGLLSASLSILAVITDSIILIVLSLFVSGIFYSSQNTATYSLYADSVPQGARVKAMTNVAVVTQSSMALGPLISAILFWYFGDYWTLGMMHGVLLFGFGLLFPASCLLTGWVDCSGAEKVVADARVDSTSSIASQIPYLVCLNDLITCVGAGMTVKFFPLFFKNEYDFSPVQLQLLFTVYLLSFGVCTLACERVSHRIGRIPASLLFSGVGVACLFLLAKLNNLIQVVLIFIVRGACQNSIYPIDRSLIMDYVPSNQRGRWNAFESVSSLTWSGSAALGGYLMDLYDYRFTFQITAMIYAVAFLLRLPLLFMVPRGEKFDEDKKGAPDEKKVRG